MSALPFTKIFGDISNATNNFAQTNTSSSPSSSPSVPSSNTPSSFHSSAHAFNLDSTTRQFSNSAGSQTIAASNNFPILAGWGMATFLIRLKRNGVLEPHWHPNSAELSYCINGRARMTIFPSNSDADSFTVNTFTVYPGEIVFVPQGFCTILKILATKTPSLLLHIATNNQLP